MEAQFSLQNQLLGSWISKLLTRLFHYVSNTRSNGDRVHLYSKCKYHS